MAWEPGSTCWGMPREAAPISVPSRVIFARAEPLPRLMVREGTRFSRVARASWAAWTAMADLGSLPPSRMVIL